LKLVAIEAVREDSRLQKLDLEVFKVGHALTNHVRVCEPDLQVNLDVFKLRDIEFFNRDLPCTFIELIRKHSEGKQLVRSIAEG